jgi:hypothetical protein
VTKYWIEEFSRKQTRSSRVGQPRFVGFLPGHFVSLDCGVIHFMAFVLAIFNDRPLFDMHAGREMSVFPCVHVSLVHTDLIAYQNMMNLMTIEISASARYELVEIECN